MTGEIALGPGAEFDAIRELLARWGTRAQGVGDDAAVWSPPRGDRVVASVDTAVDGRHFRRDWLSLREIGYRAVAAALSDLAAMAAHPSGVLISLVVPSDARESLGELADGFGEAVTAARTVIRGGNISSGSELSITTTVFGHAFAPLMRSGATPGDKLFVTGRLGAPGAALTALRRGERAERFHERFAHPVPRLAEARWLAWQGASAAVDISDGLVADAGHLAAASDARIVIDAPRLPLIGGIDARDALVSGEEYELLVTGPAFDTRAFEARFGIPLTEIGRVRQPEASGVGVHVKDAMGARVEISAGHDHFSR
ncbi:MAG TPA: thiamine-phosphate kinase [Gemmatimonadaceae bacterium]|nr:thiamine-phosphate kinase [Gemmatimonadaceae bacterium]